MNRIKLLDKPLHVHLSSTQTAKAAQLPQTLRHHVCHALFAPLHYERKYAYPLLIWLHGAGNNEQQLKKVVPCISLRNYVAIAPRGPSAAGNGGTCGLGYTWRQTDDDIVLSEHRVLECIELARLRFHIASDRIYLVGSDWGGTMALRIGMLNPHRFAGIASLGGAFPAGRSPLVRIKQARRVQLLIAHARKSASYSEAAVCRDLQLLHAAGMSVTLRQYPCGDELMAQMFSDVDAWVMQQVAGAKWDSCDMREPRPHRLN